MAPIDVTYCSPSSLDFGTVVVGDTKTLTLTFTNASFPDGAQDITVAVSAPFTLSAGAASFTLAALGDEKTISVTYTPTAVEDQSSTLTWTTDATYPDGDQTVALTAAGGTSDLTKYTLPVIYNNPAGNIGCYLYVNDSIPALTIPTSVRFISVGNIKESIDAEVGVTEFDNIEIEIAEDYTTYAQGFWHKLINEYPDYDFELMFTVFEGADETFSFRGKIYRTNIQETEYYLNATTGTPSTVVRGVKFRLVSSLKVLENVSLENLRTEVRTHDTVAVSPAQWHTKMDVPFASMIHLAYGDAYDAGSVINNSTDIQMGMHINGTTAYYSFLEAFMPQDYWMADVELYPNGYLARFANAFELLMHLCGQFGVVPRYTYGDANGLIDPTPANNTHRIVLNSRGRSAGTAVTMTGNILSSEFRAGTSRKSQRIMVANIHDDTRSVWYLDGVKHLGVPEPYLKFDIVKRLDFYGASDDYDTPLAYIDEDDDWHAVMYGRFWDYSIGAYVIVSAGSNFLAYALAEYLFKRMGEGRIEYTRTYGSIKAYLASNGSTQRNCQTLMRHVIHDGITSRTFYATEVDKDITKNMATIVWVQE